VSSGQSPITGLASFGSSVIATGALDGSIFLAHTLHFDDENRRKSSSPRTVRGVRLEWPKKPPLSVAGVQEDSASGAISCLVATKGSFKQSQMTSLSSTGDGSDLESNIALLSGCRLVGGTTGGNLAVWSIPDAMEEVLSSDTPEETDGISSASGNTSHSSGVQSANITTPSLLKKWNKSKRGKSLGGHRGGVTCLSIPPQIYRPDSLISGGNDGLIKLWSLRNPQASRNRRASMGGRTSRILFSGSEKAPGKETLDVLAGHGGRVMCVETAWHGDRLLSGAADRTVKLWDLASQSGGRCLQTMHGHTGWVTHGRYWGRNTIISASSDRSIALWDTRSGSTPRFVLRLHNGPISDLYLESRNSYWMASAGADGTVATWDFRTMQHLSSGTVATKAGRNVLRTSTTRSPMAKMHHAQRNSGPVMLSKGVGTKYGQGERSIMSVSVDNAMKEWDVLSGNLLNEHKLKHSNKISCFQSFHAVDSLTRGHESRRGDNNRCKLGGTITSSWDGTVRLRQLFLDNC